MYLYDLLDEPRDDGDDVLSSLRRPAPGGGRLTDEEIVLNCYGLILAGDETGRLALQAAVYELARRPDQWRALRDAADLALAVDEILRWSTPVMHIGRTAVTDTEIGGQRVRAGDIVTAGNGTANRDPAVFARPDRLDLSRAPNPHLALGFGPHFCLGAYLGRLELASVLAELRATVSAITVCGATRRIYSTFLQGFCELPVALTPA